VSTGTQRLQWRFMWKHATGRGLGAQWRDEQPSAEDVADWFVDFRPGAVWVERRVVVEYPPERVNLYPELAS
jgi:hypothetical protein